MPNKVKINTFGINYWKQIIFQKETRLENNFFYPKSDFICLLVSFQKLRFLQSFYFQHLFKALDNSSLVNTRLNEILIRVYRLKRLNKHITSTRNYYGLEIIQSPLVEKTRTSFVTLSPILSYNTVSTPFKWVCIKTGINAFLADLSLFNALKVQKIFDFFVFWGSLKWEQWREMG